MQVYEEKNADISLKNLKLERGKMAISDFLKIRYKENGTLRQFSS